MSAEFENDFEEGAEPQPAAERQPTGGESLIASTEEVLSDIAGQPVAVVFVEERKPAEDADEDGEEEEANDDDFFTENEVEAIPQIDPATVITIRNSASQDRFVEAGAPMPLIDAIQKSGLRFNGDFTCWLNGAEVPLSTMISGGMTVTVVGSVKGGFI